MHVPVLLIWHSGKTDRNLGKTSSQKNASTLTIILIGRSESVVDQLSSLYD